MKEPSAPTLNTQVLGEEFDAKVRHYPNALSDALFADNMPEAVYRQLVAQANAGLPTLYRYLKLRKKLLGIKDELAYYDMYPAMFTLKTPLHFTVEDSEHIALDVTSVYGPEYTAMLKKGFSGRWMDVLPQKGKASGAYMNGSAYDVHPYLLLNHNYDYESLSTLTHEWGHAVHTLLDDETQPYEKSNYSTFIAETASISNEMLLNDYMVAHAKIEGRKALLSGPGTGADPHHLLPPDHVRRIPAGDSRGSRKRPSAVGQTPQRHLLRPAQALLRRRQGRDQDRSGLLRRMGVHPALLLRLLRLSIRHFDGGRGRVHPRHRDQSAGRARPFHRHAEGGRFGLSLSRSTRKPVSTWRARRPIRRWSRA